MKKISSVILVFLLAIFIFSPVRAEKIQVKTVDGVQVVKNPKKPAPPKGALIKMILEEDFTIGEGESEKIILSTDTQRNTRFRYLIQKEN